MVVNSNDSAGDGRVSPANASASEPSTSILMKAGSPYRVSRPSSVMAGTRMVLVQACPSQPGAPLAARRKSSDAVDTVGLSTLSLKSSIVALRPTATGSIATAAVDELERLHQRGLRLDRHDARAEAAEDADAVADMSSDVEDEIAGLYELAVEARHGGAAGAIAIIDAQRAGDPSQRPPGFAPALPHDRSPCTLRHRDCGQLERAQFGRRQYLLRQTVEPDRDQCTAGRGRGGHHRERDREERTARKQQGVGNGR